MRNFAISAIIIASVATSAIAGNFPVAHFCSIRYSDKKPQARSADIENADLKRAQGVWSVVRYKVDGMGVGKRDGTEREMMQVVISGRKVVFQYHPDDPKEKMSHYVIQRLDSTTTPKQIDAILRKDGEAILREGIYRIDNDVITCEFANPGQPRPKMFQATSDEPTQFLILRQAKPTAEKSDAPKKAVRIPHKVRRPSLAFSPDGKLLAVVVDQTTVLLWDVAQRKEVRRIPTGGTILRIRFSPDGKTIATGGMAGEGDVRLWDVATAKRKREISTDGFAVLSLEFSPDGKWLLSANAGTIDVWDLATGERTKQLKAGGAVDSLAFSPDGRLLATVSGRTTVEIWDFAKRQQIRKLPASPVRLFGTQAVAFSPDGKTLATASEKGQLRLWDVKQGTLLRQFGPESDKFIWSIAFSRDGKKLLSGHFGSARLWDTKTGTQLNRWKGTATAVAYSPGGDWLAWGDMAGTTLQSNAKIR